MSDFLSWLRREQGKEGTIIPEHVMKKAWDFLDREKLALTRDNVTMAITKTNLARYLPHIPKIFGKMSSTQLPHFSDAQEELLVRMYEQVSCY